jgi:glycosyltransferase involved in cell wall biosynthesis
VAFGEAMAAAGRRFDVVHAHNGLPDGAAAGALASALGVPLVVTEHDSTLPERLRDPAAAAVYRELLASATVVTVSEAIAARITDALDASGAPAARLHGVLPNVVPLSRFPPPSATAERDLDQLLWVGARAPHKGFETLLRAFAIARARRPALHLRAIGSSTPDDETRWRALIDDLGIGNAVVLEPAAAREDVGVVMRRAGLFVHPSPFETFGMVAAEALASGLPVAATPSGGVEGILDGDLARGEVALAPSPEALADAIERLRDRADTVDRPALRATVEARYAPHVIAARTLALYAEAGARAVEDEQTTEPVARSSRPIVGAVVVGRHPSAAARVGALPAGALPVRLVQPRVATAKAAVIGEARLLTRIARLRAGAAAGSSQGPAIADPMEAAWRELGGDADPGRVVLVPADIEDVSAIATAFDGEGARHLAPGSLRWLGDVRDASAARVGR